MANQSIINGTFNNDKLDSLYLKNIGVFKETDLKFSTKLNIIVGENGTGKTFLLKIIKALLSSDSQPEAIITALEESFYPILSVGQLCSNDLYGCVLEVNSNAQSDRHPIFFSENGICNKGCGEYKHFSALPEIIKTTVMNHSRLAPALFSKSAQVMHSLMDALRFKTIPYFIWDCPENGLNDSLQKEIAKILVDLATTGTQVFIASHSPVLLKALENQSVNTRWIMLNFKN